MAVKTFLATNNLVSVHQEMSETSPGSLAFLSPVTGWVVGTAITNRSKLNSQVEATVFDSATYPNAGIDTTNGDCFRSTNTYTGSFAAANWSIGIYVASNTIVAGSGRAYFRLYRGTNADGTGATQITSSALTGGTIALIAGAVNAQNSGIGTFNPGVVTLTNEYLFLQVAWERTIAGGMSTSDVNIVSGTSTRVLLTPDFTPAATVFTQSLAATFSPTAALRRFIIESGFTAALSFIGNLAATKLGQLFLKSFSATLFPSSFDPSTITGLKLWLKADSFALSDGAAITTWTDQSGNGYNLTGTATYKTNIVNSQPIVRFNGTSDKFVGGSDIGVSQPETLFCVGKQASKTTEFTMLRPASSSQIMALYTDGRYYLYAGTVVIDTIDSSGAWHVFTGILSGSNATGYIDGSLRMGPSAAGAGVVGTVGMMFDPGAGYGNGDIAELLLYNSALSSTDRGNVENYLGTKYAISVSSVGSATTAATLTIKALKAFAATLSSAVTVSRRIAKSLAATSSRSAALTKKFIDSAFTATLSFIGNLARAKFAVRALTATLSFTGAFSRRTAKAFSAELDFLVALVKNIRDRITATLSFVGNLAMTFISGGELLFQSLSATLSFSGNVSVRKLFVRAFTATLSFAGAFSRRIGKAIAATLSFVTNLTRNIRRGLSATLSFIGNLIETFIPPGPQVFTKAFTATLALNAALVRRVTHILAAAFAFIGNLAQTKLFLRAFTATLNTAGAIQRTITKAIIATRSSIGVLTRRVTHSFTATLAFIAVFGRVFPKAFSAALSFAGNLIRIKLLVRAFTATLNTTGALKRRISKSLQATFGFSATMGKGIRKGFSAALSFIGFLFRGGAVTVLAGWITKCLASISITGSTANVVRAGSQLTVEKLDESGVKIQVTGSQLTVERTK